MREEIIKFEEDLRLAMISSDVDKLDELISDSLVFTTPLGDIATKQMDLQGHKTGIQKITELLPSEQNIQIYDNFAVVTVKMHLEGTYGGQSINGDYRYLRVWAKIGDSFQVVVGTVTQIVS